MAKQTGNWFCVECGNPHEPRPTEDGKAWLHHCQRCNPIYDDPKFRVQKRYCLMCGGFVHEGAFCKCWAEESVPAGITLQMKGQPSVSIGGPAAARSMRQQRGAHEIANEPNFMKWINIRMTMAEFSSYYTHVGPMGFTWMDDVGNIHHARISMHGKQLVRSSPRRDDAKPA